MIDKFKLWITQLQQVWSMTQDLISIKGGLFVDAFALVMIIRLLAVLKGYPALTVSEAGMWASTIAAFAYTKGGPNGQA